MQKKNYPSVTIRLSDRAYKAYKQIADLMEIPLSSLLRKTLEYAETLDLLEKSAEVAKKIIEEKETCQQSKARDLTLS